jgi:hypothetical protein
VDDGRRPVIDVQRGHSLAVGPVVDGEVQERPEG